MKIRLNHKKRESCLTYIEVVNILVFLHTYMFMMSDNYKVY